jgi:hypothetical protein
MSVTLNAGRRRRAEVTRTQKQDRDRARAELRAWADSGAMERMSSDPRYRAKLWRTMEAAGMPTIAGGAAIAPGALPPAAGGVDVASALTSVVPGIRKLKKIAVSAAIPPTGGTVTLDLPKSNYAQKGVVRIEGSVQIIQPASAIVMTATDPRTFVQSIEFQMSGATSPRKLSGLQHDIIDNLDVPAIAPNAQTYSVATGANSSTTAYPFVMEFSPTLSVSDVNLYGIPYLGGNSTVPKLVITFADPNGTLASPASQPAAGAITLINGTVTLELWRIDLPGPVNPSTTTQVVNGQQQEVTVPGQGLYLESSYLLLTKLLDSADLTAAGTTKKFKLPIGPDYLRMVLLAMKGGALDDETSPLLDHAELVIQQATTVESKRIWQFDNEYRRTYNKTRPKGVYVFSGIDLTGTDADLYVSRELGNFDIDVYGSANTVPANSRFTLLSQQLVPLSEPGQYL